MSRGLNTQSQLVQAFAVRLVGQSRQSESGSQAARGEALLRQRFLGQDARPCHLQQTRKAVVWFLIARSMKLVRLSGFADFDVRQIQFGQFGFYLFVKRRFDMNGDDASWLREFFQLSSEHVRSQVHGLFG